MAIGFWAVSKEPGLMAGLAERETSMLFCSIIRFADGRSNILLRQDTQMKATAMGNPGIFFFQKGRGKLSTPRTILAQTTIILAI